MNRKHFVVLLCAAVTLGSCSSASNAATVDLSLNLDFFNPFFESQGGDWTLVARTDSAFGIAGIRFFLEDIDTGPGDIALATDIGAVDPIITLGGPVPPFTVFGSVVDFIYGQDISSPSSVVFGVGTASQSDGPDPFGDPTWDDATIIAHGTFGSVLPSFVSVFPEPPLPGDPIDANVFTTMTPPLGAEGTTTVPLLTVVRVDHLIPEPSTAMLVFVPLLGLVARRRGRS